MHENNVNKMRHISKRYLYLFVLAAIALEIYVYFNVQNENLSLIIQPTKLSKQNKTTSKKSQCKIPNLNPFDKAIRKYIYKEKELICSKIDPLITSDLSHLYINAELLTQYNVTDPTSFYCCYQTFTRRDPNGSKADTLTNFQKCVPFYSKVKINDEFVLVICKQNKTIIHQDVHNFVPIKRAKNDKAKLNGKLNVLMYGIDSLSRMNYIRQMPKTKQYIDQNLQAISMEGYNKVGDNTFPNLIPVLTGQTLKELKKTCWPKETSHFDSCSFIWQKYQEEGFLTSFAEDSTWMGLFNYMKRGFKKQPTDYYWRTFDFFAEKNLGSLKKLNSMLCIGPRATHKVLLNYAEKFMLSLKDDPYFSIFWSTGISHDNLNDPALGDNDYVEFFQNLVKSNVLNNTVLIFLSDHGIRWGDIRSTYQGHLEERLPMLNFIFPKWFAKLYPNAIKNLKINTKRLTSNFDLYETLFDLIYVKQLTDDNLGKRSLEINFENNRGISLFLPIPEERTCEMAGIEDHWCTCKPSIEVKTNDIIAQRISNYIVSYINKLLIKYKECEILKLAKINNVRMMSTNDFLKNNKTLSDYTVILTTTPSNGTFEATVRCVDCNLENDYEITGTISRINTYGNESICMKNQFLKLYCFCK